MFKYNISAWLLMLFTLIIVATRAQQKHNVFLNGTVSYFEGEVSVEDISEFGQLKEKADVTSFTPDTSGNFAVSFYIRDANYFRIGRNILYLSPGDSLTMTLDYRYPEKAVFTGKNAKKNEYLKFTLYPKGGSFLEAGDNIRKTISETIEYILNAARSKEEFLDSFGIHDAGFKKMEKVRIKADVINSLKSILFYYTYVHKLNSDSVAQFQSELEKESVPHIRQFAKGIVNKRYLKIAVYRTILSDLKKEGNPTGEELKTLEDWENATTVSHKIKSSTNKVDTIFLTTEISRIQDPEYRNTLLYTMREANQLKNGDPAVDFMSFNDRNNAVYLSFYKGKIIYLKLWATWCGPCLEEFPAYNSLKEIYKNNDRIAFISLSIDTDIERWRQYLSKTNPEGIQLIVDRQKLGAYRVEEIPRSILIDDEFKVRELIAPLPSSAKTKSLLDQLLFSAKRQN
ncbi:MAG: TlpA family protein disulfide reductase [Chitinophagaceae bacterium]|nr:TlpA family protein disulfide reductase [Chitinophagaceae bacterium]